MSYQMVANLNFEMDKTATTPSVVTTDKCFIGDQGNDTYLVILFSFQGLTAQ